MKKIVLISLVTSAVLMAGGYKIPENSTNAVALGSANIAHNHNSADAAYYNPAKMIFMTNENHIDANMMYIGLEKVKYDGTVSNTGPYSLESESEGFIVPSFHYVSPKLGESNARVGLSIVSPGGLSKRWDDSIASYTAKEFTLETIEVNPSAAFEINKNLSFAVGMRFVYTSGVVKAEGFAPTLNKYSQDMDGSSVDVGYNLALSYIPMENLEVGITYRSKINLNVSGSADLVSNPAAFALDGNYDVDVQIPLPATFNLAVAYTLPSKTTVELVYERTAWSTYNDLNFEYSNPIAEAEFGTIHSKNWKDTNTFRLGITQELETLTLMGGLVIDESPVPNETIGFELPDTDSVAVSLGGRYKINEKMDIALAGLYSMHKDRTVSNDNLNGEFTDGNILIVSVGLGYRF